VQPSWADIAAVAIAALAFLLSIPALILSYRSNRKSNALQEEQNVLQRRQTAIQEEQTKLAQEQTELQRRQTETQERLANTELARASKREAWARRADMKAVLRPAGPHSFKLHLSNLGPGTAHRLELSFLNGETPIEEHEMEDFPIPEFAPGDEWSAFADVARFHPPWDTLIRWKESGDTDDTPPRTKRLRLKLP
jgi:hypothetical protein